MVRRALTGADAPDSVSYLSVMQGATPLDLPIPGFSQADRSKRVSHQRSPGQIPARWRKSLADANMCPRRPRSRLTPRDCGSGPSYDTGCGPGPHDGGRGSPRNNHVQAPWKVVGHDGLDARRETATATRQNFSPRRNSASKLRRAYSMATSGPPGVSILIG